MRRPFPGWAASGRQDRGVSQVSTILASPRPARRQFRIAVRRAPVQAVSSAEFWADQVHADPVDRPVRVVDPYRSGGWKAEAERQGRHPAYVGYVLGAAAVLAIALMIWTGRQIYLASEGVSGPVLGGLFGGVAWSRHAVGDLLEASFPGGAGPAEEPFSTVTFVGRLEGRRWLLRDPEAEYSVILLQADRDALPNSPSDAELAESVADSLLLSMGASRLKAAASSWNQQPSADASGEFDKAGEAMYIQQRVIVILDRILVQQWTTPAANQERYARMRDKFMQSLRYAP